MKKLLKKKLTKKKVDRREQEQGSCNQRLDENITFSSTDGFLQSLQSEQVEYSGFCIHTYINKTTAASICDKAEVKKSKLGVRGPQMTDSR